MYQRFYTAMLIISSVALFIFTLIAGYREITPEYRSYKSEYRDLFMSKATGEFMKKKAESIDYSVQQVYLGKLNRIDRCINCHLGVENPLMEDAEVPFKKHSGNYLETHNVAEFGCTVCHYGQGRATNAKEAHGTDRETHWDWPILPLKYIESACAQCHDPEMLAENGSDKVQRGKKQFVEKGCRGCHKVNGVGGVLGKALDGIGTQPRAYFPMRYVQGDKTAYTWLKEHFDDPRAIVPESEMRIVLLKDEDADLLTTYILTIRADEMPRDYRRIRAAAQKVPDGEELYKMYCIACHTTGKYSVYDEIFKRTIPAIMNSAFLRVADDDQLRKFIEDGRDNTQMTDWKEDAAGLTDDEINKIVKFLAKSRPEQKNKPFGRSIFDGDISRGQEIYEVRCAFCHGEDGMGGKNRLGISLVTPVVKEADPEFLLQTVRDGRAGTPMIPFGSSGINLSDQDILDVVAYVKSIKPAASPKE